MLIKNSAFTQSDLMKIIKYDPETGYVFRLRPKATAMQARNEQKWKNKEPQRAGSFNKHLNVLVINILGKSYRMHRIIWFYMTGEWPEIIDHINGDSSDNRWCNLRNVTQAINIRNCRKRKDNKSGIPSIRRSENGQKWLAEIKTKEMPKKKSATFICIAHAVRFRDEIRKEF